MVGLRKTAVNLCLVLLFCAGACLAQAQYLHVAEQERDLSKPIRVGTFTNFYPHAYQEADGRFTGFTTDLLDAVARVMDLSLQRQAITPANGAEALRSGQVDLLQSWSETPERRAYTQFTFPFLRCESVIVTRDDGVEIKSAQDLRGREVAVGQKGNVGDRCIEALCPEAIRVYGNGSVPILRELNAGRWDAAVVSRLTAANLIHRDKLTRLRFSEARLPGYDVRYCFAVRKGDEVLLARLNEGLAILHRTGEFNEIYDRWFGHTNHPLSPLQIASITAGILAFLSAISSVAFLRQRGLSKHIEKQSEELRNQRTLLAALHDNHPLATLVVDIAEHDRRARLISVNRQAKDLLSLPSPGPEGLPLEGLKLPEASKAFLDTVLLRWRESGSSLQWEFPLPEFHLWFEVFLVPLGLSGEGNERLCILASDITKRHTQENELALSRRQRALGELVGGVAHEFNNLLTPIMATTSMLREERPEDAALRSDLHTVDEAAKRGAELTKRLLTFGRKREDTTTSIHLHEAVQTALNLLRHTLDRRIHVEFAPAPLLRPLVFNQTDLHQILFNLLINARDTLNEKLAHEADSDWQPWIRVRVEELSAPQRPTPADTKGRRLLAWQCLHVEDNGMGMSEEVMDRIYEPFFTTKEVGTGTGLGLATSWHIIHDAGGSIDIDSKVGEHTHFRITLPVWEAAPQTHKGASCLAPAEAAPPLTDSSRQRVLLVEDEEAVAKIVCRIIERLGHHVEHAPDGQAAWERIQQNTIQAYSTIILDMNMPRMNGLALARRLHEVGCKARRCVMSGRVTDEEYLELIQLGVDKVVAKPVSLDSLRQLLGHSVEGRSGQV